MEANILSGLQNKDFFLFMAEKKKKDRWFMVSHTTSGLIGGVFVNLNVNILHVYYQFSKLRSIGFLGFWITHSVKISPNLHLVIFLYKSFLKHVYKTFKLKYHIKLTI